MLDYIKQTLECITFLILASGFLNKKILINYRFSSLLIIILGQILYNHLPLNLQNDYIFFVVFFISYILVMILILNCRIIESILTFFISYVIMIAMQFPMILLDLYVLKISNYEVRSIVLLIYCILISLIIKKLCPLNKIYVFLFNKIGIYTVLVCNIFVCGIILSFYYKINTSDFKQLAFFFFFSFILLLYLNIVLFNQFKKIKLNKQKLKAYEEYIPIFDELITQIRTRQHQYTNEIQTIISLMHIHKDYDSLTNAMTEYINNPTISKPTDYLLKLNFRLVAGFLYQKEQIASSKGIHIHFDFSTYTLQSKAPEYVLVELFGIMLDNAIEAVSDGSIIEVHISSKNGQTSFKTINNGFVLTQEDRNNFFKKGYSTKKDIDKNNSGLGLYHLRKVVLDDYSGSIALWNNDTDIVIEIVL